MAEIIEGPPAVRPPLVAGGSPFYTHLRATADTGVDLVPLHTLFGATIADVSPGHATYVQHVDGRILDDGRLLPGALFVGVDATLGSAIATCVPVDLTMTTLEMTVEFVRLGAPLGDRLRVRASLGHSSERSALASGEVTTAAGEVLARISTRCGVIRQIPSPTPPPAPAEASPAAVDASPDQSAEPAGDGRPARDWRPHLGLRTVSASASGATLVAAAGPGLTNMRGHVQGGVLALLAERAITTALDEAAPASDGGQPDAATFDLTYVRPATGDGTPLTATAEVEHAGRRFAVARAVVTDSRGRPVLLARGTRLL
ncbi:hypothetical protein FRACA_460015 [Frankia canadensis]|uniref:Thioesterase domain-containing protein n=1 Tax=Frankia canadensis TaxID=1836972 RepID=A0A2I2KXN3_9ACTN|nr:PaaI family thioesterase [Frankia canadensis]SNQ50425.1 hypothetical protein FRACA_460015 [Frankia canadensis]SOU57715.1 hypothetical protein FRACA_460015 [Frankia canadensis]